MNLSDNTHKNTSFINSILGIITFGFLILTFLGFPTIKSFFDSETKNPQNVKAQKKYPIDKNLLGAWRVQEINEEEKCKGSLTEEFFEDGTGISSLKLTCDDHWGINCLAQCPFRWEAHVKSDTLKLIKFKFGIPEILKFETKAAGKALYEIMKFKVDAAYSKKNHNGEYILQGDFLYIDEFDTVSKTKQRSRFIKVKD